MSKSKKVYQTLYRLLKDSCINQLTVFSSVTNDAVKLSGYSALCCLTAVITDHTKSPMKLSGFHTSLFFTVILPFTMKISKLYHNHKNAHFNVKGFLGSHV